MKIPENIEELEEATGLTFTDILLILEDELNDDEDTYKPLDFNESYNRFE
jgi:hypothetical protein